MENSGKRQAASIFGGMGFYIALLVCVSAAGVVGYYALLNDGSEQTTPVMEQEPVLTVDQAQPKAAEPVISREPEQVPVIAERPVVHLPEEQEEARSVAAAPAVEETVPSAAVETVETAETVEEEPVTVVHPIMGETVAVFAVDQLIYDSTMGDWRTHDGIDIQAPEGTAVSSAAAGTVLSVTNDSRMGNTVVIEHANGYVTTYAGLQEQTRVRSGDSVSAGTVIGCVGSTALAEAGLGSHLHFSVTKDAVTVDPEEFLG